MVEMSMLRDINARIHATDKEIAASYAKLDDFATSKGIKFASEAKMKTLSPIDLRRYSAMIRHFDNLVREKDKLLFDARREESKMLLSEHGLEEGDKVFSLRWQCNCTLTIDKEGHIVLVPYDTPERIYPITIGKYSVSDLTKLSDTSSLTIVREELENAL